MALHEGLQLLQGGIGLGLDPLGELQQFRFIQQRQGAATMGEWGEIAYLTPELEEFVHIAFRDLEQLGNFGDGVGLLIHRPDNAFTKFKRTRFHTWYEITNPPEHSE